MRRSEKRLSDDQSREILDRAEYGSLATIDGHGRPYITPISFVLKGDVIYLHGATQGSKLENIASNSEVGFSVVGRVKLLSEDFSTAYESAVVQGRATIVQDVDEKRNALMLLAEKYSFDYMGDAAAYIDKSLEQVAIIRIDIYKLSGKGGKRELL